MYLGIKTGQNIQQGRSYETITVITINLQSQIQKSMLTLLLDMLQIQHKA